MRGYGEPEPTAGEVCVEVGRYEKLARGCDGVADEAVEGDLVHMFA